MEELNIIALQQELVNYWIIKKEVDLNIAWGKYLQIIVKLFIDCEKGKHCNYFNVIIVANIR